MSLRAQDPIGPAAEATSPAPARRAILGVALGGAALAAASCAGPADADEGVSAAEDLMREHGVLRRLLVVYRESARLLRAGGAALDPGAIASAADLFRRFGEDYHEKALEEAYVFPAVRRTSGPAAALITPLTLQHDRGRAINAWVMQTCAGGRIADAAVLAAALDDFARMYEAHAALEDTVVFQAWKASMSRKALEEMGEKFEQIEKARFKGDGFDLALDEVAKIEQRLGLNGLDRYTAPAPVPAAARPGSP